VFLRNYNRIIDRRQNDVRKSLKQFNPEKVKGIITKKCKLGISGLEVSALG
jgi:hypothetical protein